MASTLTLRRPAQNRQGPKVLTRCLPGTRIRIVVVGALLVVIASCSSSREGALPHLEGAHLEVVAVWQDAEAEAFEAVLADFEDRTGAEVTYTSTGDEDITAVLDDRITSGDPPDLAVLPQPGLIERYASTGAILPADDIVSAEVRSGWGPVWQRLGSLDGRLFGVWFKVANKSLVWYSLGTFERAGLVPPEDLGGLADIARSLATQGVPAFSVTGAASDAWTVTDWFENLYLRIAGPERYDALAAHQLPWTDPSVATTLRTMAELLRSDLVTTADGAGTTFPQAVAAVFSPRARAAMVMEGDFVPGVVAGATSAEVGVDVDVFAFPGRDGADRFVVGGGDAAVLMRASSAGQALLRYLASTDAAAIWAERGGFISPNAMLDLTTYPDPTTRRIARSLLEAGDGFRFDLSDLQPAEFGGTTGAGMWAELASFLTNPTDVEGTMARLEATATAAWGDG
jgi:ABC-type glycerol-3-phosphate transport system substrate-binding protein